MDGQQDNVPNDAEVPSYYRKAWVLTLTFTTLGVLGLPLINKSPYFTPLEKRVWGTLAILWTLALVCAAGAAVWFAVSSITAAFDALP